MKGTRMTPYDAIAKARKEIERGWNQHALEDQYGNVCAKGALQRVCVGWTGWGCANTMYLEAVDLLNDAIPETYPVRLVAAYNDDPSTTKADVLALFDRAANRLVPVGDPAHVYQIAA